MIRVKSSSPVPLTVTGKGFLATKFVPSTVAYPEPCQTSKMEHFAKIVNGFYSVTFFKKRFI